MKAEWRVRNQNGQFLWHLVYMSPIIKPGKPTEWFGFLVDIHAQKTLEQTLRDNRQLKEAQQQLEYHIRELNRSNEELQQFAFVASHDLQEPLRKVIFYSDYFQSRLGTLLDDKSTTYLKGMMDASHRMRILIKDLLAFGIMPRGAALPSADILSNYWEWGIALFARSGCPGPGHR